MSTPERRVGGLWCHEVLERLPDLLDGALSADELGAVHDHLAGCDLCTRFGGAYASVVSHLRADLPPAPPVDDPLAGLEEALRGVR